MTLQAVDPSPRIDLGETEARTREAQRARDRMRYVKPRSAGKVVAHDRYWTVQFLRFYLERCDALAFESPKGAYLFVQQAPELARRIRVGDGPGDFGSSSEKLSGVVTALATQMACCCAVGELAEAERAYERAVRGLGSHTASAEAMAELQLRSAVLWLVGDRTEAALEAASACLELCADNNLHETEADAVAMRGFLLMETEPGKALFDLLEAAGTAHDTGRGLRTAHSALNHLIRLALDGQIALKSQESALRHLQRLKHEMKGTKTSARKLKPLWVEGLMLGNLRIDRHAKRQVGKARLGMRKLGLAVEFATASLDLAHLHVYFEEQDAARDLLVETVELVAPLDGGADLADLLGPLTEIGPGPDASELLRARDRLPPMPTQPGIVPKRWTSGAKEPEVRYA